MSEDTSSPLNNVITIDDERIKSHLDRVVRGTVEETLNALLDAEADRLCNAQRYERHRALVPQYLQPRTLDQGAGDRGHAQGHLCQAASGKNSAALSVSPMQASEVIS